MKGSVDIEKITETVSDMIEEHILVCTPDGTIIFSNRAMHSHLGYEKTELLEQNFLGIIEKTYIDKAKYFMNEARETPSEGKNFLFAGKSGLRKLPLKVCRKNDLLYMYGNKKEVEHERLRRKLDTEVVNATKIHQQFLPEHLPETDSLCFSYLYLPAEDIGGDLFDLFKVDNGLLDDYFDQYVCFIADVSGHGLDSAMLSIFVKDTIKSYFQLQHTPGQLLSPKEILDFLVTQYRKEGYPDEYLVCLFLVVFDIKTMELTYSSAGFHESPFLIRKEGDLIELDHSGMPISAAIDQDLLKYEDSTVKLSHGMTLFMMSDGLPEQRADKQYYADRYKKLAKNIRSLEPEQITEKINEDFMQFVEDGKIADDITLVVTKLS